MAQIKWNNINQEDILEAIDEFDSEQPNYLNPKGLFLIFNGKKYPAKMIRKMAYNLKNEDYISEDQFKGGSYTVNFFNNLGFDMEFNATEYPANDNKPKNKKSVNTTKTKQTKNKVSTHKKETSTKSKDNKIKISSKNVLEQKNALQLLLIEIFDGEIVSEKSFEWMRTPKNPKKTYPSLFEALRNYRNDDNFAKSNYKLRCDFVSESNKIIIEYDERQHFTEARRLSLLGYPDIPVYFDKEKWIKASEDIQAVDNTPYNRDEARAYYDSIRDIEAYNNGYKLIRIMHEEFDFEREDAYEYLETLIRQETFEENKSIIYKSKPQKKPTKKTNKNQKINFLSDKTNIDLKIGMYLQSEKYKNPLDFKEKMNEIKNEDFDIIVFPEFCYTPFSTKVKREDFLTDNGSDLIIDESLKLSKKINKAVVLSLEDKYGSFFSIFANYFAEEDETDIAVYIKNTMTGFSPFDFDDYEEGCIDQFPIIEYKGYKIGLTICNDGNHAPFSRMYGLQQVDVLLNSSGGDVKYKKWYTYHKTRSIENNCFSLVTMGGYEDTKSYTYAFNPNGGMILPENLHKNEDIPSTTGEVYIYDLSTCNLNPKPDKYINQKETTNKYQTFHIPQGNITSIIKKAEKIKENVYKLKNDEYNIIFIIIEGYDILKPELVIPQLYDTELSKIKNKKYILVNQFKGKLDEKFYENYLSIVLKTRTTENYVTVILESDNINKCYQPTNNKDAQVIRPENGEYGIEIKRASGPEALWTTKRLMKKEWRNGFETVIENMIKLSNK